MALDAAAIYQDYLDRVSPLVWDGRLEAACDHMLFPNQVEVSDARIRDVTRAEMLLSLDSFRESLLRQGAQAYYRLCLAAQFDPFDRDRLSGRHRTYVLRGGTYVIPPVESRMSMRRVDGRWLAATLRSEVRNAVCTSISPKLAHKIERLDPYGPAPKGSEDTDE